MPEYRKKLIEVALPLESINKESAREKSIRFGHPSTLHLWWARRPLAACRAVLFAQMVDDPSSLPEEFPTEEVQEAERQRLFRIIEEFVKWENITNEAVLHKARVEIARSAARNHGIALPHSMTPAEVADALKRYAPPVLDPFAGGGSIPLEAQRLGLEAHASDINPVAVLINKALIEIPPKFAGRPPVNPESREKYLHKEWKGAEGLAEDIRYYGNWMRDEAWMRIGRLYPKVRMPKEQGVDEATVIAWIWARTVKCPNPACCSQVPLTRTFQISAIKGAEMWVEPIINHANKSVHFTVRQGHSKREGTVSRSKVTCLVCDAPMSLEYIRAEGQNRRMGTRLMAIVAERGNRRICLSPNEEHEAIANVAQPTWEPNINLSTHPQYMGASRYGLTQHKDLFTSRQLVALDTFSELVRLAHSFVITDSDGDIDYADAVATYLGLGVSRLSDICNALCTWGTEKTQVRHLFGRQAIPMLWDFGEANVFGDAAGDYRITIFNRN